MKIIQLLISAALVIGTLGFKVQARQIQMQRKALRQSRRVKVR
jgi:hypothetical protein